MSVQLDPPVVRCDQCGLEHDCCGLEGRDARTLRACASAVAKIRRRRVIVAHDPIALETLDLCRSCRSPEGAAGRYLAIVCASMERRRSGSVADPPPRTT